MSGRGRDEEEAPAGETEATNHEAQEIQPPSPFLPGFCPVSVQVLLGRVQHRAPNPPPKAREPQPPSPSRPAGPTYQELGFQPLLGGPDCQEEGRVEEGPEMGRREGNQEAEPLEEEPLPPFKSLEEPSPTFKLLKEPSPTVEPLEEGREKPPDLEDS